MINKYYKYKNKFLILKNQIGGMVNNFLYVCKELDFKLTSNFNLESIIEYIKQQKLKVNLKPKPQIKIDMINDIIELTDQFISDNRNKYDLIYIYNCANNEEVIQKLLSMLKINGIFYIENNTKLLNLTTLIDNPQFKIILRNTSPTIDDKVLVIGGGDISNSETPYTKYGHNCYEVGNHFNAKYGYHMDWTNKKFWDGLDKILGTHNFDAVIFDNDCYNNFFYYNLELVATDKIGIKAIIWYSLPIIKKHITTDGILLMFGESDKYPKISIYNYFINTLYLNHIGKFKILNVDKLNSDIINILSPTTNNIINTSNIFRPDIQLRDMQPITETSQIDFIKRRLLI